MSHKVKHYGSNRERAAALRQEFQDEHNKYPHHSGGITHAPDFTIRGDGCLPWSGPDYLRPPCLTPGQREEINARNAKEAQAREMSTLVIRKTNNAIDAVQSVIARHMPSDDELHDAEFIKLSPAKKNALEMSTHIVQTTVGLRFPESSGPISVNDALNPQALAQFEKDFFGENAKLWDPTDHNQNSWYDVTVDPSEVGPLKEQMASLREKANAESNHKAIQAWAQRGRASERASQLLTPLTSEARRKLLDFGGFMEPGYANVPNLTQREKNALMLGPVDIFMPATHG